MTKIKVQDSKKKPAYKKIDPHMPISELLLEYPNLAEVLTYEYGLHCVNCMISDFDTLMEGAAIHDIEGKDLEEMIEHLEKIINEDDEKALM